MERQETMDPTMFDRLNVGIFQCRVGPGKGFLQANKTFLKMLGYSKKDVLNGMTFDDLIVDKKDKQRLLSNLKKNGKIVLSETTFQTKKNKILWVTLSAHLIKKNGRAKTIEGIIQRLPSARGFHDKVSNGIDPLQTFLDSIPDAIYFKDRKNQITRVNKFYADGFGGKMEKIIGKTDFDFFPHEQAKQMFYDDNYVLRTGKSIVGKIEKSLLPNGTWNQVITTKVPIYDSDGKITGTMGITRDMTAQANLERERYTMVLNALMVLGKALEMRDPYTQSHARDVGEIAIEIGRAMKFDDEKLLRLKIAAELHDLGKISIPLDILIKPGKLSDLEYRIIKEHTNNCYNLVKDIEFPFPLAEIIYQHHERMDGSGYPRGLKGNQIAKEARILAVSDVLEAMTHHRPYRAALGIKKAAEELKQGYGTKYDSKIVAVALKLIKQNKGKPFWKNSQSLTAND